MRRGVAAVSGCWRGYVRQSEYAWQTYLEQTMWATAGWSTLRLRVQHRVVQPKSFLIVRAALLAPQDARPLNVDAAWLSGNSNDAIRTALTARWEAPTHPSSDRAVRCPRSFNQDPPDS